jgi:rhamnosyltransferase
MQKNLTVGVVMVTYCAAGQLTASLKPLFSSPLDLSVLVIDSSSPDGTAEMARQLGADVHVIPKSQFNHGATREMARKLLDCDIVVMMTQDAYPVDHDLLSKLIAPLIAGEASIAYARQLPRPAAGILEAFARSFNYPAVSELRSLADVERYGAYTYFCSNSCAAYLSSALDEIGGFDTVVMGEDTIAVAKLLHRGHRIAYVAEARVYHSHDYSLRQEFARLFDAGAVRWQYRHLLVAGEGDRQRGWKYLNCLMRRVWQERRHLIPYAIAHIAAKWLGYKCGQLTCQVKSADVS